MKRHLTKDSLLMIGILLVGILLAVLVVYRPQSQQKEQLRGEIASMEQQLAADARGASVVPAMLRQVNELRQEFRGWDRRLPGSEDLGGFLKEISLAQEQQPGIISEGVVPGVPHEEKFYYALPIIMRFRSSYLDLAGFLKRISKMDRLTRVNKLVVVAAPGETQLEVELHLNIYYTKT